MASNEDVNMANSVYDKIFECIGDSSNNKMRGHSLDASAHRSRSLSIFLSKDKEKYHVQVKKASDRISKDKPVASLDNI